MKKLTAFILSLLVLVPVSQLSAKNKSSANINFRVTRFDPSDRPSPEYVTPSGTTFKVPMHNISQLIKAKLRDGKYLDLRISGSDTKKKPAYSLVIPEAMRKDALLIFIPKRDSYSVMPIHSPLSKLGGGSRLLVNATGSPLAIKYGKTKPRILPPGKKTIFRAPSSKKMIQIQLSIPKGDQWKLMRSERWPVDSRFRSFVFVYKKPNSKRLAVHAIPDRIK